MPTGALASPFRQYSHFLDLGISCQEAFEGLLLDLLYYVLFLRGCNATGMHKSRHDKWSRKKVGRGNGQQTELGRTGQGRVSTPACRGLLTVRGRTGWEGTWCRLQQDERQ
jgi:hypothetical protein